MDRIQKCFQLTWLTMKCYQEMSLKINVRKLEVNKERETIKETAFRNDESLRLEIFPG